MATVCVLAAGQGSRMGDSAQMIHKGLLPIHGQAILTQIIERFPAKTRFVFAVHHLAAQVQDYISSAHPDLDIEYVQVQVAAGPGSGPGRSLYECREALQEPFYIVCSDTLWQNSFSSMDLYGSENWIGCSPVPASTKQRYCNLQPDRDGFLREIFDKSDADGIETSAFVGLAFVHSYERFFHHFDFTPINGEVQISNGFRALLKHEKIRMLSIDWLDTGTNENYKRAVQSDQPRQKTGEHLYFVKNRVVKFFDDIKKVEKRFDRSKLKPHVFPNGVKAAGPFLSYEYQPGNNLYKVGDAAIFDGLLHWMNANVWGEKKPSSLEFATRCREFYVHRALSRLNKFESRFGRDWFQLIEIDSTECSLLREKIDELTAEDFALSRPSFIHGDFTLGNVIFNPEDRSYRLIDWREDFAGSLTEGDIFLDFAKMFLSITMDLEKMAASRDRQFEGDDRIFKLKLILPKNSADYVQILSRRLQAYGAQVGHLDLYCALSLLAMAGVHEGPVAMAYFLKGAELMAKYSEKCAARKIA